MHIYNTGARFNVISKNLITRNRGKASTSKVQPELFFGNLIFKNYNSVWTSILPRVILLSILPAAATFSMGSSAEQCCRYRKYGHQLYNFWNPSGGVYKGSGLGTPIIATYSCIMDGIAPKQRRINAWIWIPNLRIRRCSFRLSSAMEFSGDPGCGDQ